MPYYHGIRVKENPTNVPVPARSTGGVLIAIGTAPGGTAKPNEPVLVNTYAEAAASVGYSDEWDKYTLCQAISACFLKVGAAPIVLINVYDPQKHGKALAETEIDVANMQAVLAVKNVILSELVVKNGADTLAAGTDYFAALNDEGDTVITILDGSSAAAATRLKVSGKVSDISGVTAADIIGGLDVSTGEETGLEAVRKVYPKLGEVPGLIIAPGWSHIPSVAAALSAKAESEIGGDFKCMAIVDINSTATGAKKYTDVQAAKAAAGLVSPQVIALWPKVIAAGDAMYYSAYYAAVMIKADAENGGIPSYETGNRPIGISGLCLDDAENTEILLDHYQANEVNSYGVVTALNLDGFRTWGNSTCCYPGITDPKDRWIVPRRLFNWERNNLIIKYTNTVDSPASYRTITAITDAENVYLNSLAADGHIAGGRVEFNPDENPISQILDGHLRFNLYMSPYVPAEDILFVMEFDVSTLEAEFGGGE